MPVYLSQLLHMYMAVHFRQLHCDRIRIHINLFLSYLLTGVTWILYYVLVMLDGFVLLENPVRDFTWFI